MNPFPVLQIDSLPRLEGLPCIGKQPMPEACKLKLPALTTPTQHLSRIERRRLVELTQATAATAAIGRLPQPGEAIHCRMDGSYNGYDLIPALVALAAPETIATLYVATLSFNHRVGERLLALIDAGKINRVVFVSSEMFQGKERATVDWLAKELDERGGRLIVARNHCKLILAHTTGNQHIVAEGSQNLRTCNCYEQFTLTDDAELFAWHVAFIEGLQQ